jgi:hypothetical protein
MIKALVGLMPKTYQTGAWPGIGEFVRVRPVIGVADSRPNRPWRCDGDHTTADFARNEIASGRLAANPSLPEVPSWRKIKNSRRVA